MTPVLQSQSAECGLACLAMIANAHGLLVELDELRRLFPLPVQGSDLTQLIGHAAGLGFAARPVRLELDDLSKLPTPCILHWNLDHFVVLVKTTRRGLVILDPAVGERRLTLAEASSFFTGVALELTPAEAFEPADRRRRFGLAGLTGPVLGLKRSLALILAVALVLELFVIAGPMLSQIVVDDVLATGDHELLTIAVAGFGLLLLAQSAIAALRSWMTMRLGQRLHLQWAGRLYAHLLRLPLSFFEQRPFGDVVSRFGSLGHMQRTLTTSALEALLDGAMALAALAMMLVYAPRLAAVVAAAVVAYAALRWAGFPLQRAAASERLVLSAREQSQFLETLRAMSPLRRYAGEPARHARWHNLLVDVHNRDVRATKLNIGFTAAHALIFGVENLLVLWLGARLVMEAGTPGAPALTIGMLLAFIGYKVLFTQRVAACIDHVVQVRMLALHAARVADIALHAPEPHPPADTDLAHLPDSLELRNVSFRHADSLPWVLRHASVVIEPGDHVAITGASGAGKSTLLRLLLGLIVPTEGDILYGGVPVQELGWANVRRHLGSVLQDDVLLTGSLADNIAFFDPHPDPARIEACARVAHLHADIARLPMGYHTPVGDLGAGLSGGQRQRLLIARALYRRPRVLLLDEATSHLDVAGERAVVEALTHMQLTRIVVAHRPETIAAARRVLELHDGRLHEPAAAVVEEGPATPLLQGA